MRKISLLGSTGSIGVNTLDVVARNPERFEVCALSAGSNVDLLAEQVKKFKPRAVSLFDPSKAGLLREQLAGLDVEIFSGQEGSVQIATYPDSDLVVSGMVGSAGLVPALKAIEAGKNLALANKETLVVAGELVLKAAKDKVAIIPIDSEHSAIFQALNGEKREQIKKIILTASGGPFRTFTREQMEHVTVEQALNHPNWSMGNKITIDSATMMNKGLEYIEAKWLFGLDVEVDVIIHAQSIIHSMIEFVDTSIMAQLGIPDMRVPIAYALSYPDRLDCQLPSLDLSQLSKLTFEPPDTEKFPCLKLAIDALDAGQTMPAVLNAANEVAVQAFLDEVISFKEIPEMIRMTMDNHKSRPVSELEDVLEADRWTREETRKLITVAH
ncbi:MAG: 1-deoxy-D-xylulose 5-phosphate reductoisomerase [Nitrospinaceae bacterium]|nr:MAG: 1-deoxy-D-xylulose 5-phosphate reductoisomerase [Nitrospinaceae bacterium]